MTMEIKYAVEMYNKACLAEEKGQMDIAELYYLKSRAMFEAAGGISGEHYLNAANALNSLAFLRWSREDYEGALCAAKASIRIIEKYSTQFTSTDADFIYNTSCELSDQIQYEMSLVSAKAS
jgi:hypothetical protein